MLLQLLFGSALTLGSVIIATIAWWALEAILVRLHSWAERPPHGPKLMVVLSMSLIFTLLMMTAAVWLWGVSFHLMGVFGDLEEAIYFSLVAFTTLGFGDILLPEDWRLLGGLAAANGLLMFGLLTAILVEILRDTRVRQRKWS